MDAALRSDLIDSLGCNAELGLRALKVASSDGVQEPSNLGLHLALPRPVPRSQLEILSESLLC